MKKTFAIIITSAAFFVAISGAKAQMMGSNVVTDNHTVREETEGMAIWQKLQSKETNCASLSDDDFGALGEYFMGQMIGSSHPAMNQMMVSMMGQEGEKQAHIAMGKRLSGCDASAAFPLMGGPSMMGNWGRNSMWLGGAGSWLITLTWIVWLGVGVFASIWLWKRISKK